LGVEVNGVRCRRLRTLTSGQARFRIPATLQRPGRNLLVLRRPGGERRQSAFPIPAVTRIELHRTGPLPPRAQVVDDRLVLPVGTSITFYLRAPEAAGLAFRTPAGGGVPRVTLLVDGAEPHRLAPARGSDARWEARLEVAPDVPMGISLEAEEPATVIEPVVTGLASIPPHATDGAAEPGERPNVLLYVMDTLRADRLGCYGYGRETSPHLDRFAREGIVFRHAIAQAPWTRPSMASIMTGQLPPVHGAVTLRDRLGRDLPTLAEAFRAAGYQTAGFVTNLNVAAPFGFDRGFDRYEHLAEDPTTPEVYVPADRLHETVLAWLEQRAQDRPFFLYLHASDVHTQRPSPDMERRLLGRPRWPRLTRGAAGADGGKLSLTAAEVQIFDALYDAEIATWDAAFGGFWKTLRAHGRDADTFVVFTADHGEEFHDHGGLEHGHTLYGEQLHVPLVVRLPRGRGGGQTADEMVRSIDLLPTLGAFASPSAPGETPGMPIVRADG
jgi:hypothetical protein